MAWAFAAIVAWLVVLTLWCVSQGSMINFLVEWIFRHNAAIGGLTGGADLTQTEATNE